RRRSRHPPGPLGRQPPGPRPSAPASRDRNKWLTPNEKRKLLALEREAAHRKSFRKRGEPTSRRLQNTYDQIRRLHAKAKRRAEDWQHQTTTTLALTYSTVAVEDLTITNMTRSAKGTVDSPGTNVAQKAGLNRSILQESWGRMRRMLAYKLERHGGTLAAIPARHTSQRCHACGFITPGNRESQALFVCKNHRCGWTGNADFNAAQNILHLYRTGHALVPAAGSATVRRTRGVKPTTAR
ncbi:transposase, partial [Streptomyces colonosanans]|uniref:RNA-guided endonuclease InsQ/TnpB family protein n=1 Tax=Streptomyces colonosanans TaxID=1428652 RepID=UPI0031830166